MAINRPLGSLDLRDVLDPTDKLVAVGEEGINITYGDLLDQILSSAIRVGRDPETDEIYGFILDPNGGRHVLWRITSEGEGISYFRSAFGGAGGGAFAVGDDPDTNETYGFILDADDNRRILWRITESGRYITYDEDSADSGSGGSGGGGTATGWPAPRGRLGVIPSGQSNPEGRGTARTPLALPNGVAYEVAGNGSLSLLADPVGGASSGSMWPAMAQALYYSSGMGCVVSEQAAGGTGLHPDSSGGAVWDPRASSTLYPRIADGMGALDASGLAIDRRVVVWGQGERDAQNGISQAQYADSFKALLDQIQADHPSLRVYVVQTGKRGDTDNAGWQGIRAAQAEVAASHPIATLAYDQTVDFWERGLMGDALHYNQDGLNRIGAALGQLAAAELAYS